MPLSPSPVPSAAFRIAADGGLNRLYDALPRAAPPPPTPALAVAAAAAGAAAHSASARVAGLKPKPAASALANGHAAPPQPAPHAQHAPGSAHLHADPAVAAELARALRQAHLPDLVIGDLDSLRPDTEAFYAAQGVPFMDLSHDQVRCWLGD